jgi:hypothetical protein
MTSAPSLENRSTERFAVENPVENWGKHWREPSPSCQDRYGACQLPIGVGTTWDGVWTTKPAPTGVFPSSSTIHSPY